MRAARDSSAGFSLLEVLVGLALMATLSLILIAALRSGIGLWERRNSTTDSAELAAAFRALQSNLERALPIPECAGLGAACAVAFDGGETELRFVVANPGRVGRLGDTVMRLSVDRSGRKPFLAIAWAPYDSAIGIHVDVFNETLLLLGDMDEAAFEYFGDAIDDPSRREWQVAWEGRDVLPSAVRIKLRSRNASERVWTVRLVKGV